MNPTGLDLLNPGVRVQAAYPDTSLGLAGDGSHDMVALDGNIPGQHTPALPAILNPAVQVNRQGQVNRQALSGISSSVTLNQRARSLPAVSMGTAIPLPPEFINAQNQRVSQQQSTNLNISRVEPDSLSSNSPSLAIPAEDGMPQPASLRDLFGSGKQGENVRNYRSKSKETGVDDLSLISRKLSDVGINKKNFTGNIGTGVVSKPDYWGSNDIEFVMLPVIDLVYRERLFLSTEDGLGLNLYANNYFDTSVYVNWRPGRKASGDIKSFEDRSGSAVIGLEVGTSFGPFRLFAEADYAISGDMKGIQSDIGVSYSQALGEKVKIKLDGGLKLADSNFVNSAFGISASDNYKTETDPVAGLVDVHAGLEGAYFITPRISLNLGLGGSILMGDAAESPIVTELGSKTQWHGMLSTRFRF